MFAVDNIPYICLFYGVVSLYLSLSLFAWRGMFVKLYKVSTSQHDCNFYIILETVIFVTMIYCVKHILKKVNRLYWKTEEFFVVVTS